MAWVLGVVCGMLATATVKEAAGRSGACESPARLSGGGGGGKLQNGMRNYRRSWEGGGGREAANVTGVLTSAEEEAAGKTRNWPALEGEEAEGRWWDGDEEESGGVRGCLPRRQFVC